jgi:hypothetical protein
VLFPKGVGLNSQLGQVFVDHGISRTIDYTTHAHEIVPKLTAAIETERRTRLFSAEGRAFWTELGEDASLPPGFKQVLARLLFEANRIVTLLLADCLCWSALKRPLRLCPFCKEKFTTFHFFACPQFFRNEQGWKILVGLCRAESWEDVPDFIFTVLAKWVSETSVCRADFRLHVSEYVNLCSDVAHVAFRWNVI